MARARVRHAAVCLLLLLIVALVISADAEAEMRRKNLRRQKREWILPPAKIYENTDYTQREYIAKIRSDKDKEAKVEYYLAGKGADKPPFNLFIVNPENGFVRITGILDREKCPMYNLTGVARYRNGTLAEANIPLQIHVVDLNDNSPYFELHSGSIAESSKAGTEIMQIIGKDDDQEGSINSKIHYKILSQKPAGSGAMFTIDENTGKLFVKDATLDRETHDSYTIIVQGADMGGAAGGNTGTGTVEIKVLDINDNIPTLEKGQYAGKVDENIADVIVMRIKAVDRDLEHTDNWRAVFHIAQGNEDGLFSIETDQDTNEGILKLIKAVDFEEVQKFELGIVIENVAPFVVGNAVAMDVDVYAGEGGGPGAGTGAGAGAGAGAGVGVNVGVDVGGDVGVNAGVDVNVDAGAGAGPGVGIGAGVKPGGVGPGVKPDPNGKPKPKPKPKGGKNYPISIAVNNMPEGPAFKPSTKPVTVSEDPNKMPKDGVIASYPAVDGDTGEPAEDVRYAKAYDPDNWVTIDDKTAEIRLIKTPDRESKFLVNGTYFAKILVITQDMPSKTATGTIAIQVQDSNDHCPMLTTTYESVCSGKHTVNATAFDEDVSPNGAPFTFTVVAEGTRGKWEIEHINGTTAVLRSTEALWPGEYEVRVAVADEQGLSCPAPQVFKVEVCTCLEGEDCDSRTISLRQKTTDAKIGTPAIGLLILASCVLLLVPLLLLFCQCRGAFADQFTDLPFDAKEYLISYHTEGKGEDKEVPLLSIPTTVTDGRAALGTGSIQPANIATKSSRDTTNNIRQSSGVSSEDMHTLRREQSHRPMGMEIDYSYGLQNGGGFEASMGLGSSTMHSRYTTHTSHVKQDIYEDMALPCTFLDSYYSQKVACASQNPPQKDSMLVYDYEGQGSPVGSVGCCSLLESDNNLQFLNDMGPKFKTLADICSPPKPQPKPRMVERIVEPKHPEIKRESIVTASNVNITKSSIRNVNINPSSTSTSRVNISQTPPTSPPATGVSNFSNSQSATFPPPPTQTILLQQQPMYYTTMQPVVQPLMQPIQYVLADGGSTTNLKRMVVLNGPPVSGSMGSLGGLVIQGNRVISETSTSPISPSSPGSPTMLGLGSPSSPGSPTMLGLGSPRSPGWIQGSLPRGGLGGLSVVGHSPDGNYVYMERQVNVSGEPQVGSGVPGVPSQGSLPRGAFLVKEAAPPQGVLGLAAQGVGGGGGGVYGVMPGHNFTRVRQVGGGPIGVGPAGMGPGRVGQIVIGSQGLPMWVPQSPPGGRRGQMEGAAPTGESQPTPVTVEIPESFESVAEPGEPGEQIEEEEEEEEEGEEEEEEEQQEEENEEEEKEPLEQTKETAVTEEEPVTLALASEPSTEQVEPSESLEHKLTYQSIESSHPTEEDASTQLNEVSGALDEEGLVDSEDQLSDEDVSMVVEASSEEASMSESDIIDLVGTDQPTEDEDFIDLVGTDQSAEEEDIIDLVGTDQPAEEEDIIDLVGTDQGTEEESAELTLEEEVVSESQEVELTVDPVTNGQLEKGITETEEIMISEAQQDQVTVDDITDSQEEGTAEEEIMSQLQLDELTVDSLTDNQDEEGKAPEEVFLKSELPIAAYSALDGQKEEGSPEEELVSELRQNQPISHSDTDVQEEGSQGDEAALSAQIGEVKGKMEEKVEIEGEVESSQATEEDVEGDVESSQATEEDVEGEVESSQATEGGAGGEVESSQATEEVWRERWSLPRRQRRRWRERWSLPRRQRIPLWYRVKHLMSQHQNRSTQR
ncbi:desmoglein-2.1 isoform X2 [Salvelinus sp. IW2-2015]|uniref:desmoglein-2.1 isoform X2 n=2 Tax=Salvelinus sp. IW2-2015 TaxID=2691554 RepID=UPI0038D3E4A6